MQEQLVCDRVLVGVGAGPPNCTLSISICSDPGIREGFRLLTTTATCGAVPFRRDQIVDDLCAVLHIVMGGHEKVSPHLEVSVTYHVCRRVLTMGAPIVAHFQESKHNPLQQFSASAVFSCHSDSSTYTRVVVAPIQL